MTVTVERLFFLLTAGLCLWQLFTGLRSGAMPLRRLRFDRHAQPIPFALAGAAYAGIAALMLHGALLR